MFPGHGAIYGCGDGLFAIIGTVDLEGFNYINARVHFNASALTHLDEYVFVASNVEFGDNNICTQDGQTQLSRINVGRDTGLVLMLILTIIQRLEKKALLEWEVILHQIHN